MSEPLDRAARGEEIVITKRGRPIARLTGFGTAAGPARVEAAIEGLHALARDIGIAASHWDAWKDVRDDGRR